MKLPVALLVLAVLVTGCSDPEPAAEPRARTTVTATPTTTSAPTVSAQRARQLGLRAVAALKRDDPARALELIDAGADVNVKDRIEDSVFLYAGAEGYLEVVEAALELGADVRSTNRFGGTALIPASEHAHLEVIQVLLTTDVPIDHVNELGWTALGEAVALGDGGQRSLKAVTMLLASGADARVRDRFGRTPLQNAERLGYTEIAALLRDVLRQQSGR